MMIDRPFAAAAWYYLTLPLRLARWRFVIRRRTRAHDWRPCRGLPDNIVCALHLIYVCTRLKRPTPMKTSVRCSVFFEVIARIAEGSAYVRDFCARHGLPPTLPRAVA